MSSQRYSLLISAHCQQHMNWVATKASASSLTAGLDSPSQSYPLATLRTLLDVPLLGPAVSVPALPMLCVTCSWLFFVRILTYRKLIVIALWWIEVVVLGLLSSLTTHLHLPNNGSKFGSTEPSPSFGTIYLVEYLTLPIPAIRSHKFTMSRLKSNKSVKLTLQHVRPFPTRRITRLIGSL